MQCLDFSGWRRRRARTLDLVQGQRPKPKSRDDADSTSATSPGKVKTFLLLGHVRTFKRDRIVIIRYDQITSIPCRHNVAEITRSHNCPHNTHLMHLHTHMLIHPSV